MGNKHKIGKLSLVVNNDQREVSAKIPSPTPGAKKQLNLPFVDENLFALIPAAMLNSAAFSKFIRLHKPRWIYDLRKSPRLDLIAGSRQCAFDTFQSFNANYVALKSLTQTSDQCPHEGPIWWANSLKRHLNTMGSVKGPYILIFDNQCDLELAKLTLTTMVEKMLPESEHLDFLEYN